MSIPQGVRDVVWSTWKVVHHWEGVRGRDEDRAAAQHERCASTPGGAAALDLSIEHISTKRWERQEFEAARPWPYGAKKSGRSGVSPPGQP